ncbi:hypothetical protein GCM10007103_21830 [Salinimicrobium marinum]|uniref:Magnesium citrate secondary transporter n=1 Tax=Salinimicrobium marinum TaxID=680283 RepID=A0A918SFV2_9FLAO|nr:hypothetical protein [Salinimicrobium marinum]GHA40023.1 hypothetical protein GCM10007103_21830 [Salinimicrobium marinum]
MNRIFISFAFFIVAFLIIQFHQFLNISLPDWILFYGKDFICLPIVLTVCLLAMQFLKKDHSIRLDLFTVLSMAAFYAFYFELYLPKVKVRYTADFTDVVMYFLGALLFYFLQEKPEQKTIS